MIKPSASRVASRNMEAGLLQPPPKMTEDVLAWVLSCWAKTTLAIQKAKGKKWIFDERYKERLAAADPLGVVIRQGRPEQRTFPIDLQGWRYGDRRDAIFEGAIRKNRELMSHYPDSEALAAYKQQLQQTFQEYLDSGMPLRVTLEHSDKKKGNFNESTNTILIRFTSATTEKWLRKAVFHEMRHYAQILLSQSIDSASDEVFRAGLPSRSIRTPEYDQNQGTLYEDTRLYLHSLDDVEFYTNLADSIEEIKEALLAIPQEYDENTGRMDSLAREERFKEMVGAKSSPNIHRFFKYLKRNRKARGKYQKAVSEAYAALVDDVFSGASRFRVASRYVRAAYRVTETNYVWSDGTPVLTTRLRRAGPERYTTPDGLYAVAKGPRFWYWENTDDFTINSDAGFDTKREAVDSLAKYLKDFA